MSLLLCGGQELAALFVRLAAPAGLRLGSFKSRANCAIKALEKIILHIF